MAQNVTGFLVYPGIAWWTSPREYKGIINSALKVLYQHKHFQYSLYKTLLTFCLSIYVIITVSFLATGVSSKIKNANYIFEASFYEILNMVEAFTVNS